MKNLKFTSLMLLCSIVFFSCETENPEELDVINKETIVSLQNAKAASLPDYKGVHNVTTCFQSGSPVNTISFFVVFGESGALRLMDFNGQAVFEFFTANAQNEISLTTSDYTINGSLVGNKPVFDVSYTGVNYCTKVSIKASNGKYVSSENGLNPINANRNSVGAWEAFEIVKLDGNKIALRANNGKYMSSENGLNPMNANRSSIGAWEQFEAVSLANNKVALKANNGKYVSSENGQKPMNANRSSVGAWEEFDF